MSKRHRPRGRGRIKAGKLRIVRVDRQIRRMILEFGRMLDGEVWRSIMAHGPEKIAPVMSHGPHLDRWIESMIGDYRTAIAEALYVPLPMLLPAPPPPRYLAESYHEIIFAKPLHRLLTIGT